MSPSPRNITELGYLSNQLSGVGIQEYYEREYKDDLCFDFYPLFSMILSATT